MSNRIVSYAAGFVLVWIIGSLLIIGRGLLIPFIIALIIWNLLNTISNALQKTPWLGERIHAGISMFLAFFVVIGLMSILLNIIGTNVTDVIDASARYQTNLMRIFNNIDQHYRIKALASFDMFVKNISLQGIVVNIYAVFTTITSSAVLIALYVAFLFVEQHFFMQKLQSLFPQPANRHLADSIISHMLKDTQTYLGLKTLLSLISATASWVIMRSVGLDFSEFWALLIFFLYYIPNIGAIIAMAFPALLALIQFQTWIPFIIVTSGVAVVQFLVGNVLEPRFLSKSLNLSPLVILIALALWGAIWGVLGMFLAVPMTVIMMIFFAHFEKTRPIAILLSQNGYVNKAYE